MVVERSRSRPRRSCDTQQAVTAPGLGTGRWLCDVCEQRHQLSRGQGQAGMRLLKGAPKPQPGGDTEPKPGGGAPVAERAA